MDFWKILNIEPTMDKDLIKKAYLSKLKETHPEEKPDEFAQLKEAYELAKNYEEKAEVIKTPFRIDLERVYFNFGDRVNVEKWKELLNKYLDKDNTSLESLAENKTEVIRDELLAFLMDEYNITTETWNLIEKEFNIVFDNEVLAEKFPKNFIDFVVHRIQNGEAFDIKSIPIDETKSASIYDEFINKSLEVLRKLRNRDDENPKELVEIGKLFDEIEAMNIPHITNGISKSIFIGLTEGKDAEEKALLELEEQFESNIRLIRELGLYYYSVKKYEEALSYFNKQKEIEGETDSTLLYIAACTYYVEDYENAKQLLFECSKKVSLQGYLNFVNNLMYETNKKLVDVMIKKNEETNFSHYGDLRSLASCYFNLNDYEKAYETIILVPEEDRGEQFYKMYLHTTLFTDRLELFKEGLDKFTVIEREEGLETVGKLVAMYYQKMGDYEKSLEVCSEYINNIEQEIDYAYIKVNTLKKLGRDDDILELANRLRESGNNNFTITLTAAEIYRDRGNFNSAFTFAQMANEINHYNAKLQEICMDCRYYFGHYDEVLDLHNFVVNNNLQSVEADIIATRALLEKKEDEKAVELMSKAIEIAEGKTLAMCYRLKSYAYEMLKKPDQAIETLEEFRKNNSDVFVTIALAGLYTVKDRYREGLALCYKEICGKRAMTLEDIKNLKYEDVKEKLTNEEYLRLCDKIGLIEYEDNHSFEVAKEFLEKSFDYTYRRIDYYYYYIAHCYSQMGDKEKAIECFRKNIAQDKDLYYAQDYKRIVGLYKDLKDDENKIKTCKEALEKYPNEALFYEEYLPVLNIEGKYEEALELALSAVENQNVKKLEKIWDAFSISLNLLDREKEFPKYLELFANRVLNTEIEDKMEMAASVCDEYMEFYEINKVYGLEKDKAYLQKAMKFAEIIVQEISKKNNFVFEVTKFGQIYNVITVIKCYRVNGDSKKVKFFEDKLCKFIEANKDDCLEYYYAKLYKATGDFKKALKFGEKASKHKVTAEFCQHNGVCIHAFSELGSIYFDMGEYKKAIAFHEKYAKYDDSLETKISINYCKKLLALKG